MSEMGGSYDPGPWRGWDYNSARKAHTKLSPHAGRSYGGRSTGKSVAGARKATPVTADTVPENLTTDAKSPLVVIVDGTGSMGQFPEVIFQKLPLLDDSAKDYLDDCEISYAMIGDAASDRFPLQVQPFGKGKEMAESLNKLYIEGNGGGNMCESYDLAALYYARRVEMPKANKPILVWVCDEGVYDEVKPVWGKSFAHTDVETGLTTKQLFDELQTKYSVYVIRKRYGHSTGNAPSIDDRNIQRQWEDLVGADRIAMLDDPKRVVDVILGLLAVETGKVDFFKKEIEWRQTPAQVKTVYKSMVSIGAGPDPVAGSGNSIIQRDDDDGSGPSMVSKSLI